MAITSAIVLYAVIWFLLLFVTLPIRLETQGDKGEVTPGTMAGAPTNPQLKKRFKIVTAVAFVLWLAIGGTIISGVITVCDFDWFGIMAEQCGTNA